MKAAILIGHGSRSERSNLEMRRIAEDLRQRSGFPILEHAFLEVAEPDISAAIDQCVKRGADEIVILQHFLNSGDHVLKDIPFLLDKARKRFPRVKFRVMPIIGSHPKIADLYLDLIRHGGGPGEKKEGRREERGRGERPGGPRGRGGFRGRGPRGRGRFHPHGERHRPSAPSAPTAATPAAPPAAPPAP